ncbi:MAG TPA: SCO family protein [Streptosporangiaceae bacterium]|jgi:protein SCO1/2
MPVSRFHAAVVGAVAAAAVMLAGCSSHSTPTHTRTSPNVGGMRGDQLSRPVTLTAGDTSAVFRASTGGSTTLGELQRGALMLLYFGYTHCPDVCPTTMADLGQALRQLPVQVQEHTQVVFVTSDPARDTPPVMKAWLSNFDPQLPRHFVGLTAALHQIDQVATSVGVPLSPPVKQANGTISVQHGAQTLAFIDGKARVLWLAGTSVGDYAHDITALAQTVPAT